MGGPDGDEVFLLMVLTCGIRFICVFAATAPGQVEDLFGRRKSSFRRSARAMLGRSMDSKGKIHTNKYTKTCNFYISLFLPFNLHLFYPIFDHFIKIFLFSNPNQAVSNSRLLIILKISFSLMLQTSKISEPSI